MKLVSSKNFIIFLAAILVIGFGIMSVYLNRKVGERKSTDVYSQELKKIETQSDSSEVEDIEKDLDNTDISDIDKELGEMQKEIDKASY